MNGISKFLSTLITVIFVFSTFGIAVFAGSESSAADINYTVKVCADKGNWLTHPENSLEAINDCSAEYISLDIRLTADGVPVLLKDETVDRMCTDRNGNAVSGSVKNINYPVLSTYRLRQRNGGVGSEVSESTVASLQQVLTHSDGKTLILDTEKSDFDAVYKCVSDNSAQEKVIFRPNCSAKEAFALAKEKGISNIMAKYDGNIIFSAVSLIKSSEKNGLSTAQIGSKNQYGVVFYHAFTKIFNKYNRTVLFSMTDGYSGKRPDSAEGWDDIISRGYGIIETDYPDSLQNYISESEAIKTNLRSLKETCDKYKNGSYSKDTALSFKKALANANGVLGRYASKNELSKAYSELNNAFANLKTDGKITEMFSFTPGRIIAASLCLCAVAAAQVFFYKRRKSN